MSRYQALIRPLTLGFLRILSTPRYSVSSARFRTTVLGPSQQIARTPKRSPLVAAGFFNPGLRARTLRCQTSKIHYSHPRYRRHLAILLGIHCHACCPYVTRRGAVAPHTVVRDDSNPQRTRVLKSFFVIFTLLFLKSHVSPQSPQQGRCGHTEYSNPTSCG
jgi:hypothetical protein